MIKITKVTSSFQGTMGNYFKGRNISPNLFVFDNFGYVMETFCKECLHISISEECVLKRTYVYIWCIINYLKIL